MHTKVQQLAAVIKTMREDRGWNHRNVSVVTGAPQSLVEEWETGRAVPDGLRWKKLCGAVNRGLYSYRQLHLEALAELANQPPPPPKAHQTKVGVSMGEKMRQALEQAYQAPVALTRSTTMFVNPAPKKEDHQVAVKHEDRAEFGAKMSGILSKLPDGWKTSAARKTRQDRAAELWRQDIDVEVLDMWKRLGEEFGVSVNQAHLREIRQQVREELAATRRAKRDERATTQMRAVEVMSRAPETPNVEVTLQPIAKPQPASIEDQLAAASQLILDAVANLASFTLTVNADGSYEMNFEVRKVETGKLTIRRP